VAALYLHTREKGGGEILNSRPYIQEWMANLFKKEVKAMKQILSFIIGVVLLQTISVALGAVTSMGLRLGTALFRP